MSTRGQIAGEIFSDSDTISDSFQGYSLQIMDSVYMGIPVYMYVQMYIHLPPHTAGGQSVASAIIPQKPSTVFLCKVSYGLELRR